MTYTVKNQLLNGTSVTVGASQNNAVLTGSNVKDAFYIHPSFRRDICIDVACSGVTKTTGITLKLQTRYIGTQTWIDSKTAAVTADGTVSIRLLDTVSGDQTFLPLRCEGRVVVSTGASDAITVDSVLVPTLA